MAVFKVITEVNGNYAGKKYHDANALASVIHYIFAPEKTLGKYIGGLAVDPSYAVEQMTAVAEAYGKTKGIRLRHMMISFCKEERITPEQAMYLAYHIAMYYAGRYQIVYAVHVDAACLNMHFVMNTVSYRDGRKYDGKSKDYYCFINHGKQVLGEYGYRMIPAKDREDRMVEEQ